MSQRNVARTIKNLVSDREHGLLSWTWGENKSQARVPDLFSALVDSKGRNVFALAGLSDNHPTHLVGFAPSGDKLFEVMPPAGFIFSYFTHHPLAPIAVVAGGESSIDNFRDWHFSISKSGVLKRIAPAY